MYEELFKLSSSKAEQLYRNFDKITGLLEKSKQLSYLDAFTEAAKLVMGKSVSDNQQVKSLLQQIDLKTVQVKDLHKAIGFILIKGMREDRLQANHQVTPDIIAYIMGYMLIRLIKGQKSLSLLDVAAGSGNLLSSVKVQLMAALHRRVKAAGIDNDTTLVAVAKAISGLEKTSIDYNYADAVAPFKSNKFAVAVSDLPVGYYPLDQNTKNYSTRASEGHSFAHHLLIEQAMRHVIPGGYGVFLVPSTLFNTKQARNLLKWMESKVYLQGMLNLPQELFANVHDQKAILLLQNRGGKAKHAKKVMIGEFPSFKKPSEFQKFMAEIVEWEETDLLR